MSLAWKLSRLSAMDPAEVIYRVRQAMQTRFESLGLGLCRSAEPEGLSGRPWLADFPCDIDAAPYAEAADQILRGRFEIFTVQHQEIGFPPEWNRDHKTGVMAPRTFGKLINYRDPARVGEIKYLWEPNRHLELVTLAQAWLLTSEPRYLQGCRALLESWFAQCPYPLGVNWCSSLELSVRLINWSVAWHLLGADHASIFAGDDGRGFRGRWLEAIRQHMHFISGHFSLHSSANNHLIGELAALYIGSMTWPMWPECAKWSELGREGLETQVLLQTHPDGGNKEQAIWYQHEVTDMLLMCALTGRANGDDFSPVYWRLLDASMGFIAAMMDVGGNVPAIGDADDALIVRWTPQRHEGVFRPLLAAGAVLFESGLYKSKARVFGDKPRWLLGDAGASHFAAIDSASGDVPRDFPDSGYYMLGTGFGTAREIKVVADAGPLGYLSIAAHGHCDALSFVLSAGGCPLLIDPGTYSYAAGEWRDYFRGTAAHNTMRIDGLDQSVAGGNFLWVRHARCWRDQRSRIGLEDVLRASHDGYERLVDPVRVSREWRFDEGRSVLIVTDEIVCAGSHELELFWHFSPDCEVRLNEKQIVAAGPGVSLRCSFPEDGSVSMLCGSESPKLGWISRSMGVKEPTNTVVVRLKATGNWRGVSEISVQFDD